MAPTTPDPEAASGAWSGASRPEPPGGAGPAVGVGPERDWSDAALAAGVAARNVVAYEQVRDRHAAALRSVARMVLGRAQACEDVVSDVLVAYWLDPAMFDPARGNLLGFLRLRTRCRSIDLLRSESSRVRRERVDALYEPAPRRPIDADVLADETVAALDSALGRLPLPEAEAIRLAFFSGLSYRAVALRLGVAEGTVKSRIRNGLARLRADREVQGQRLAEPPPPVPATRPAPAGDGAVRDGRPTEPGGAGMNRSWEAGVADPARLLALARSGLVGAGPTDAFDRLVEVAVEVVGVPRGCITLVDAASTTALAAVGFPAGAAPSAPVEVSFCRWVVGSGRPLVVADARNDPRTVDDAAIDAFGAVAWAGFPIYDGGGAVLGTFCLMDSEAHPWNRTELQLLATLAAAASSEIALHQALRTLAAVAGGSRPSG